MLWKINIELFKYVMYNMLGLNPNNIYVQGIGQMV